METQWIWPTTNRKGEEKKKTFPVQLEMMVLHRKLQGVRDILILNSNFSDSVWMAPTDIVKIPNV